MATFPVVNHISNSARTEGEVKADLEAMLAATKQIPGAASPELSLTISGGSITPPGGGGILVIDTESAAATDDLTNIVLTNYPDNAMFVVRNANAARSVVLRHANTGSGQMFLDRNASAVLDDTKKYILLARRGTDLYEVFRGPQRGANPVQVKSANFTPTSADHGTVFLCDNPLTITLPLATSVGNGFTFTVVNTYGSTFGTVDLQRSGSDTIDEFLTQVILYPRQSVTYVCDGSSRYVSTSNFYRPRMTTISFSSTVTVSAKLGLYQEVGALTGNVTTLTIQSLVEGEQLRIRFVQDATGGRTVAAPSGAKIAGSLASAANQASILELYLSFAGSRLEGFWTQIPV